MKNNKLPKRKTTRLFTFSAVIFTLLATVGVLPVGLNNTVSSLKPAEAGWRYKTKTYRWGSIDRQDEINFCRSDWRGESLGGYVSSDTFYVVCITQQQGADGYKGRYYQETPFPKGEVCDWKQARGNSRNPYNMWIASNGRDCWDSYQNWYYDYFGY